MFLGLVARMIYTSTKEPLERRMWCNKDKTDLEERDQKM
jgi:hypothetical protein